MKQGKICHGINNCEHFWERYYISCGKDSKQYQKSIAKASKDVFTIASASVYSNASRYSGDIKVCKKFASP